MRHLRVHCMSAFCPMLTGTLEDMSDGGWKFVSPFPDSQIKCRQDGLHVPENLKHGMSGCIAPGQAPDCHWHRRADTV